MKTLNLNLRRILREAKEPGILLKDNLLTTLNGLKDKISAIAEEDGDAFFSALDGAGLKKSGDSLFQSAVVDEPETKKAQARWIALGGGGSSSSEPKPSPAEAPKPSSPSKAEPTAPASTPSSKGGDTKPFGSFGAPSSGSEPGGKKGTDAPSATPSNPGGFGGGAPASEPKGTEPKTAPGTDPKPAETPKPSGVDTKSSKSSTSGNDLTNKVTQMFLENENAIKHFAKAYKGKTGLLDKYLQRILPEANNLDALGKFNNQFSNLPLIIFAKSNKTTYVEATPEIKDQIKEDWRTRMTQEDFFGHIPGFDYNSLINDIKKAILDEQKKDSSPEEISTNSKDDKKPEITPTSSPSSSTSPNMGPFGGHVPPSKGGDQKKNEPDNKGKSSGGGGDIEQQIIEIWNKAYEEASKTGERPNFDSAVGMIKSLQGVEEVKRNQSYPGYDVLTKDQVYALPAQSTLSPGSAGNAKYNFKKSNYAYPKFDSLTSLDRKAWEENKQVPTGSKQGFIQYPG